MNFRTKSPELVPRAVFSSEIPCLSAGCVLGDVSRKKEKNGVRCAGCGRMLFSRHAARRSPQDAGAARATGDVPAQGLAERQAACRKARSERCGRSASDEMRYRACTLPLAQQQCGRAQPHPKGLPPEWSATLPTGGSGAVGDGGIKYNNHFARIAACCRATMLIMFNTKQPLSFFCSRAEKKGRPMRHHVGNSGESFRRFYSPEQAILCGMTPEARGTL